MNINRAFQEIGLMPGDIGLSGCRKGIKNNNYGEQS